MSRAFDWENFCNSVPALVAAFDERGTILYVNRPEAPFTRAELVGQSVLTFIPPHEHDEVRATFARAKASGAVETQRFEVYSAAKGVTCLEVSIRRVPEIKDEVVFAMSAVNVTAQREHVERLEGVLQLILGNASDVVTRHGTDGLLRFTSQSLRDALDVEPATLAGAPFTGLLHPDDAALVERAEAELAANKDAVTMPLRFRRGGGEYIWLETSLHAVRKSDGRVVEYVALSRETAARPSVEAGRLTDDAHAELAHAARLSTIGEMAASLAHEMTQPITAIATYAFGAVNLLKQDPQIGSGQARAIGYVQEIARLADRASQIVKRVRTFAARREPLRALEDLVAITRGALAMMDGELGGSGVRVTVKLPAVPVIVDADRVQIGQVLVNLIKNAVEALVASGQSNPHLAVEIAPDRTLGVATTSVLDNGGGLSPKMQEKLFEPFRTTKPEGLGLGLAISRSIVLAHGGILTLEAAPGSGTAARFTLPLVLPASS